MTETYFLTAVPSKVSPGLVLSEAARRDWGNWEPSDEKDCAHSICNRLVACLKYSDLRLSPYPFLICRRKTGWGLEIQRTIARSCILVARDYFTYFSHHHNKIPDRDDGRGKVYVGSWFQRASVHHSKEGMVKWPHSLTAGGRQRLARVV